MFGTLHYNASHNETQYVERSIGGPEQAGIATAHFACDNCRTKKLKCDGQSHGCFRCKASSTPCFYSKCRTKKGLQRKNSGHQRPNCCNRTLSQSQTSPNQQIQPDHRIHARDLSRERGETNSALSAIPPPHDENALTGISRPGMVQELCVDGEQSLFDGLFFDSIPNDNSQVQDPSALDFSHSNTDLFIEDVSGSFSDQLLSPDPTNASPRLYPNCSDSNTFSASSPQSPVHHDGTHVHGMSLSLKDSEFPNSDSESCTYTSSRTICQCAQTLSTILDGSRSRPGPISIQTIQLSLAHIKKTLEHCTQILDCNNCSTRSDHMMLAAVKVNELVSTLEEVVQVYTKRRPSSSMPLVHQPQLGDPDPDNVSHMEGSNACYRFFIGEYAVNSETEWAAVMKSLIVILLERTLSLMERMRQVAKAKGRETQGQILWGAQHRVNEVASNMREETVAGGPS